MTIGERLKEERVRLGFTQPDFACLAETTKKSQIEYEKGNTSPNAAYLAAIAAAGADVRYIVTGDRDGPPPEVLSTDERELLALYRAAPLAVKMAAVGALQGGVGAAPSKARGGAPLIQTTVHGNVGKQIGKITAPVTMNMEVKKK